MIFTLNFHEFLHTIYKYVLNSVVKILMMYFKYYTIILRGAVFSWTRCTSWKFLFPLLVFFCVMSCYICIYFSVYFVLLPWHVPITNFSMYHWHVSDLWSFVFKQINKLIDIVRIKVRTDSSTEFGSNPILIVQIRTGLDRSVDFNERVTAFTTGTACTPISDIKGRIRPML